MCSRIDFAEEILENSIEGFHRYCLSAPIRPDYVSKDLCGLVGYDADELLSPSGDAYAAIVHPDDRSDYLAFLDVLSREPQRRTLQYRLLHKDGKVINVHDTMTSRPGADGVLYGYSTLTDVTEIKKENRELHSLNETLPCGILRYTCEDNPRVTYVNDQMLRILRLCPQTPDGAEQLAQYKKNLYLLIPPEERSKFKQFLNRVYAHDKPVAGEMTAMRCDGTRVRLYGWISKAVNSDGEEEYQSVCMDVTDRYDRKRRLEQQSYLRALSQVYDEIIELDFSRKTARFLQGRYHEQLGAMAKMPMLLEDVAGFWLSNVVHEEDRGRVREAFELVLQNSAQDSEIQPVQTEFRVRSSNGTMQSYMGIFLRTGGAGHLFCCRNVTRQAEADALKQENHAMRELVRSFTDGMLAFEIRGDCVRPLYISNNVRSFFGYNEAEWLASMESLTPIREFVSKCHITYEDFLDLLESREAEFHYTDVVTRRTRRIKAICTARTEDRERRCYVMLYDVTDRETAAVPAAEPPREAPRVYIRTFGYFDVFIDGNPIAFRNEKAKELFALLVDRRGGFVTSSEAISLLWEDEPANALTLARYRKVALRLKNTLEEYGIADIVESVDGKRRIVSRLVRCDLYDYLSGEPQHAQLFKGSYLQNYSWGELTLAELSDWHGK